MNEVDVGDGIPVAVGEDNALILSSMKDWLLKHPVERMITESKPKRRKKSNQPGVPVPDAKQEMQTFLQYLSTLPYCYNMDRNEFNRSCSCCKELASSTGLIPGFVDFFCNEFCTSPRQCRQVIEKAMMSASEADRQLQKELQRKKKGKHSDRYSRNFRILVLTEEPIFVCTQTWRVIFCVRRTRYNGLKDSLKARGLSPSPSKNVDNNNRWKNSYNFRPDVKAFLEDLKCNYSEPTATRFVRLATGTTLRQDQEVYELPPSYTKQTHVI